MFRRRYGTRLRGISPSVRPAMLISPLLGSSSFISSRMQVDLPQPVGPTRKTNSPRPIRIEAPSRPTEPPSYTFVTSRNSTTGTPVVGALRRSGSVLAVAMRRSISSDARRETLRVQGFLHHAPAREEVAAALGDRDELQLRRLHQFASGDDREGRCAAGELRVQGQEELVHEAGREEVCVERGTALAQHRADAVVLAEAGHEEREVVADAGVLDLVAEAGQGRVGPGGDHHALLGLVQEREVGGQVEPGADDHGQGVAGEPLALALVAQLAGLGHAPVALDPDRAGADHDRVGLRPEVMEETAVELGGEALGAPIDGGLAVEARDHVEDQVGTVWAGVVAQAEAGCELLRGGGALRRIEQLHGAAAYR